MKKTKRKFNKADLKKALKAKTGCTIQYTGWPCGTCFFDISKKLKNEDWQALLYYRGDDRNKEYYNNLPKDINKSLNKIWEIIK